MNAPTWQPPESPEPSEILQSAVGDTRNGEYEQALAKLLWFHHNALRYHAGYHGVRLSFALAYWRELAAVFPPAMMALKHTRDEAEGAVRDKPDFHTFHEVASLNRYLEDELRTADLFIKVAETDHATADHLYEIAERNLIQSGRFHACAPFLKPIERVESAADCYRVSKKHEDNRPSYPVAAPKLAKRFFIQDMATLVALLVLNGRAEEARTAFERSLEIVDDDEFRTTIAAAMSGHFPERMF